MSNFLNKIENSFQIHSKLYWENLSHITHLMVIVNLSMFFVTRLVIEQGYYFTFYSLLCLGIVQLLILIPLGYIGKLWYYLLCLFIDLIALYFIVVSLWFWIVTSKAG